MAPTASFYYHLTDHLGSTRMVFRANATSITVVENFHYYPFGQLMEGLGNPTTTKYRYNGKEYNNEFNMNLYDYGARMYDPILGRWNGVDPLGEKYAGWSPYNYVLGNPISFIDPDGMRVAGDFLNSKGKIIGSDGIRDGKLYVINTSEEAFTENEETVQGAGLSKSALKAAIDFVEKNSGNTEAFDRNPAIYDSFTEIEGNSSTREAMVKIVSADNGEGGTSDANNREYSGGIMADGSVVASPAGPVSTPKAGAETGLYPPGTVTRFHSHPSGTQTTGGVVLDPFGGNPSMGDVNITTYRQSPSRLDVEKSGSSVRYVFAMGKGIVYIYNNQGVRATVPLSQFANPKK